VRDAAGVLGMLGFVILPAVLSLWVLVDLVGSFLARAGLRKALAVISRSRDMLYTDADIAHAEYLISTLPNLTRFRWVPRPIHTMMRQFVRATRFALHSESHDRDLSADASYVSEVVGLLDRAYLAFDKGNLLAMAEVTGQMLVLDAIDEGQVSETVKDDISEDTLRNADKPLLLLGVALDATAQALASQDTGYAKQIIEGALRDLPLVVSDDQLDILLLVLQWARSHLHHVSDVRPSGSPVLWKSPEDVVVDLLRKAALAAKRGDLHRLIAVIARSPDAYRTPRV
jgi:hypothetical protein